MSAFILSQIVIAVAFLFDMASFQFKKRQHTLICFVAASGLISIHYFLLEQHTAGVVLGLAAVRSLTSIFTTDKRLKYIFLILITIAGIWTYTAPIDLFAIAAGYLATFAVFQTNEKLLRKLIMLSTISVIIINVYIFTPVGIATEAFFLVSNTLSYWRFYIKKQTT